jgi:hypothetical protein
MAISADLPRLGVKGTGAGSNLVVGAPRGFSGRGSDGAVWAGWTGDEVDQKVSLRRSLEVARSLSESALSIEAVSLSSWFFGSFSLSAASFACCSARSLCALS